MDAEDNEINNLFKKAGNHLYLYGNFLKIDEILVGFICDNKATIVKGVYKNSRKIGVIIPEIEDVSPGISEIFIEISFNGQQYSNSQKKIKYLGIFTSF